jgi:hypothetical protein
VIGSYISPLASRCNPMSGLIHSLPFEAKASAKAPKHKDTSGTCRDRATADLLKSVAMITANERLALERSAAIWELHAELLDRLEETERARGHAASQRLSA